MRFRKFAPSDEQKRAVIEMRHQNKTQVEIAAKLELAETTLRRYFRAELDTVPTSPGRPRFEPTDAQREEVEILIAARVKRESIATYLSVDVDTLETHFEEELARGFQRKNSKMWLKVYSLAMDGNISAAKYWLERVGILPPLPEKSKGDPAQAQSGPQGKKEVANAEAASAGVGTDWGNDLTPKGALN